MAARLFAIVALAGALLAQPSLPTGSDVVLRSASEFEWKPSTTMPPGAEYQLIREDPATRGIQAVVRLPSGYSIPPHAHDAVETIIVLRGRLSVRAGGAERTLGAGDYAVLPVGAEHSLGVRGWGSAWLLVTTSGPFQLKK